MSQNNSTITQKTYDVIVIGAGQAGLSIGYYLEQKKLNYLIIDSANEIGDSWKYRYDSLTLFTPRNYSTLPELNYSENPNGYPTKDEVVDYLQKYVKTFELKTKLKTRIENLKKDGDVFIVKTKTEIIKTRQVVVATGPFQTPFIPNIGEISNKVLQLHSSQYRNPNQLKGSEVLVVGAGNSGAQIAVELSDKYNVTLSARSPISYKPYTLLNLSIFWWLDKIGLLNASKDSFFGKIFKKSGDPVIGLELQKLLKSNKIKLRPGTVGINTDSIVFSDKTTQKFDTIIWATGFRQDYNWINIPTIFDNQHSPIQKRGVTNTKGLFFLGLPWMYSRNSGLLGGVKYDANYILKLILKNNTISH